MDTLTHALSGALLARATAGKDAPPRSIPRRVAAGFFACAAPDLDFVFGFFGPAQYILNHRGITHSLVLLPVWAFAVAWILARVLREPDGKDGTAGWRALYGVSAMAIGLHIAGDLITSYGTMVFWPFSDWRAAIGTTFIIDPWFSGIIVAGLVASLLFLRSRVPAVLFLGGLVAYVGFQYAQRERALEFGQEYAVKAGLTGARVSAQPRPVTPFNWTVFVSDDNAHRFSHVNLIRDEAKPFRPGDGFVAKLDAPYLPLHKAIWVTRSRYGETRQDFNREAWNSPPLGFFRWFAELPAFDGEQGVEKAGCAWFLDLRFDTPGRDYVPFRFGACRESPGAPWRVYERGLAGEKIPLRD